YYSDVTVNLYDSLAILLSVVSFYVCFFFLYSFLFYYIFFLFFFNDTATTEIYTLSLHDALPICIGLCVTGWRRRRGDSAFQSPRDRKSTRLNSSHVAISYAVFCLKKKKKK